MFVCVFVVFFYVIVFVVVEERFVLFRCVCEILGGYFVGCICCFVCVGEFG